MSDDGDLVKRLNAVAAHLKDRSEENLRSLGVSFSADRGPEPPKADCMVELEILLARYERGLSTGADLRRTAELVELFESEGRALMWWRRAAERGDPVSILMLDDEAEREK